MALPADSVELAPDELSFPLRGSDLSRQFELTGLELSEVHHRGKKSGLVHGLLVGMIVGAGAAIVIDVLTRRES